jgi:hypothetical protein
MEGLGASVTEFLFEAYEGWHLVPPPGRFDI